MSCALLLSGCSGRPARVKAASLDPDGAAAEAMKLHDKNGDGQLDAAELAGCPGLASCLPGIDANSDKRISRDELLARLNIYKESRVGIIGGVACKLSQKGQPLSDAEVKLVPESFLGEGIEMATGRTNEHGIARMAIPGSEFGGVRPGMYRVEVSKKDAAGAEQFPAEFNAQTRFGLEANTSHSAEPKFIHEFSLDKSSSPKRPGA